jgi:hypothetical protein
MRPPISVAEEAVQATEAMACGEIIDSQQLMSATPIAAWDLRSAGTPPKGFMAGVHVPAQAMLSADAVIASG